jgi:hypothetical protein
MLVFCVTIYFVEWYPLKKDRKQKYSALMKKIHKSLRRHKRHVPELLSYKTFEGGGEGSLTSFVEMFEFANQKGMNRFFGRFSKTEWLRTLQKAFFELVPRRSIRTLTWTPFLKEEWFIRESSNRALAS